MARELRIQYPGTIYHLTNRGGRRAVPKKFKGFIEFGCHIG